MTTRNEHLKLYLHRDSTAQTESPVPFVGLCFLNVESR